MTEIKLYNTKTRSKELFKPLDKKDVRMYVCGPTVYDRAHIGNARPVIVFDVLYRLLRHVYGAEQVKYARNFTDVDDKINTKAAETGRSIREITDETIDWYHADMDALGNLRPDHAPRATEYIAEMVAMIEELIASGHAYPAEGHVLFEVKSYENYGSLSGRSVDDMIAGARVEVAPYKRNPMDFVLWKPSDEGVPGWDSPWGRGRPGWHIECSAMARELFGERFDIHGGGLDLAFPHHENEKAQSCCEAGEDNFAQVWMHNEMLQVEGKKMSKSLGNFFSVRDLLDQGYPGEVIRFVYLSTHYRKPMDWTEKKALEAKETLYKWWDLVETVDMSSPSPVLMSMLADDLNTAGAIKVLNDLYKAKDAPTLKASAQLLGLLNENTGAWFFRIKPKVGAYDALKSVLRIRRQAKEARDFAKADLIRDELKAMGITLKDQPGGKVAPSTDIDLAIEHIHSIPELERPDEFSDFEELGKWLDHESPLVDHYQKYAADKVLDALK